MVILANSGERIYQQWYNTFMKRKPIVYLICGFIGAGKTTFAKKLEEKTGAVRITKDEWSIHFIGNDPTIDGYAEWSPDGQRIASCGDDGTVQVWQAPHI